MSCRSSLSFTGELSPAESFTAAVGPSTLYGRVRLEGAMTTVDVVEEADRAVHAADAAALAARVTIREIGDLAELRTLERLYDEIWRPDAAAPISTELLRAFAKSGNYVAGAFDADKLVGACVGFFAAPSHATLHSHIAGVSAQVLGRSVGYALKLHQRSWALL